MKNRQWPIALILLGLAPGLGIAFYFYARSPQGADLINKTVVWLEAKGFGPSIGRQYLSKNVFRPSDLQVVPQLRSQQEGMWIVGPLEIEKNGVKSATNVDTDNLHYALANATPGNTIRLMGGSYHLPQTHLDRSLTIEAMERAQVTIVLDDTLLIAAPKPDPKTKVVAEDQAGPQISLRHLTLQAMRPYYQGASIEVRNSSLNLEKVNYKGDDHEMAFALKQGAKLDVKTVQINAGDRATAIKLYDSATLEAMELNIIGAKEGISSDVLVFSGSINLNHSNIKNSRSSAIALYGGELKSEKLKVEGGQGAILLRRGAKALLRLAHLFEQEFYAIDVAENSQLRLLDSQLENAGLHSLLVQKNNGLVQVMQTQIHGAAVAITLLEKGQMDFVASSITGTKNVAVQVSPGTQWNCTQSQLSGSNIGVVAQAAQVNMDECSFAGFTTAVALKQEARLLHKKSNFNKIKTPITKDQASEIEAQP